MRAELLTKQGEHVCVVEMPFFMTPPEVVIWGERIFVHDDRPFVESENGQTYYEAFAWYAMPETIVEESDMSQVTIEELLEEGDS